METLDHELLSTPSSGPAREPAVRRLRATSPHRRVLVRSPSSRRPTNAWSPKVTSGWTGPCFPLLSTGLLGGVDVGVGVLIYLVVDAETGNPLLASMAFTIGFVALLLANSELFTENFLVPVISVVAKVGTFRAAGQAVGRHAGGQPGRGLRDGGDDRGRAPGGARRRR